MSTVAPVDEVRQLFNHICILHHSTLVRVIGFHEDALDCYYEVREIGGKTYFSSFVGWCESLKDIYPNYDIMDRIYALNKCPPEEQFRVTIATADQDFKMYGEMPEEDGSE